MSDEIQRKIKRCDAEYRTDRKSTKNAEMRICSRRPVKRDDVARNTLGLFRSRITSYNVCYTKLLRLNSHENLSKGMRSSFDHEGWLCRMRQHTMRYAAQHGFGYWAKPPRACDDEVGCNRLGCLENEPRRCLDVADLMG